MDKKEKPDHSETLFKWSIVNWVIVGLLLILAYLEQIVSFVRWVQSCLR